MNVDKVDAIAKVFPIFFFLVAALVVLTTMTRMVEEERLQIGTMKALGYSKGSIISKYVFYALSASVVGAVVGLLVGLTVLPTIVWNAYTMMYRLPKLHLLFNAGSSVTLSAAGSFVSVAGSSNTLSATGSFVSVSVVLSVAGSSVALSVAGSSPATSCSICDVSRIMPSSARNSSAAN
jgi:putative ABC transport system permease protein